MTSTIHVFKLQQEKAKGMLEKLWHFIQHGQKFGLTPNSDLLDKLKAGIKTMDCDTLKVALIGGFSEGKTSIASAWLERLDQSMNISQQESSNEVKIYRIDNEIELVDTPGLFGFKEQKNNIGESEKYKELTKKYISEAHLVLYVMNSTNPIKESHQDDLQWLFRDLNLLPRTIFVLSRFDEVADIEDEWDYRENLKTKKNNIIGRLEAMIELTEQEKENIKIVGVSANPFGEGIDYWLDNLDEFNKLSRISTLQDATKQTIEKNGGAMPIVFETQKSVIQDVLGKQLPIMQKMQDTLDIELDRLADVSQHLNSELKPLKVRIDGVRNSLTTFVVDYFSGLIIQVKGTDLQTFREFYENELGKDGIMLNTRLEQEFARQCQSVGNSLERITLDFNNEITHFENAIGSPIIYKGFDFLRKQNINSSQILATRDGVVNLGKMIGVDLAKYLKFKPWGAAKLASKVNVVLAAAGLLFEAWDSYKKQKAEDDFRETVAEIVKTLENQRESLKNSLKNDNDFINQLFPLYAELEENFQAIQKANQQTSERKKEFDEWKKQGDIIEAEYRILASQITI